MPGVDWKRTVDDLDRISHELGVMANSDGNLNASNDDGNGKAASGSSQHKDPASLAKIMKLMQIIR